MTPSYSVVQEDRDTSSYAQQLFQLFRVRRGSFRDVCTSYLAYDRKFYAEEPWDPRQEHMYLNRAKILLMKMNPAALTECEQKWRNTILHSWFNRAIAWVLWMNTGLSQDERTALAHQYVLELQNMQWSDSPSQQESYKWYVDIWRTIVNDDGFAAKAISDGLTRTDQRLSANWMIEAYKANRHNFGLVWVKPLPLPSAPLVPV